ncbi:putative signal transducing protein [Opitutus terrae]|uniref:DUF2007 domain-containing protein n=1 Tax=Opitutus terrae (strain DSM 11246 / JCM 15787 / PB90-1) TaxID=452637 RepID=B1ZYF4_OPITP|nr:DUF2007 domain-containing protein [Opitutus terrae]ACB77052.1 hypothetical protein Oter_3777 [Opitutus terrae PB90-1]
MKNLATFETPIEAQVLIDELHDRGIEAIVHDEQRVELNMFSAHTFGRVRVEVADVDYEKARDVMVHEIS